MKEETISQAPAEKDAVLGCYIRIALSDGEFDRTWADFDIRSSADVVDVSDAEKLKKLGLSWGDNGGFFKVMGGGTVHKLVALFTSPRLAQDSDQCRPTMFNHWKSN